MPRATADIGYAIVERSFGTLRDEGERYDVLINAGGHYITLQIETADHEAAEALAAAINEHLPPLIQARTRERDERIKQQIREDDERRERERPERERREAELAAKAAAAEQFLAAKCPECGHVDDPEEFEEPGYECSTDSSTGRGPEGRRCDQCNRFRARSTDHSCPSCEQPVAEPEEVMAVEVDGDLIEVPS